MFKKGFKNVYILYLPGETCVACRRFKFACPGQKYKTRDALNYDGLLCSHNNDKIKISKNKLLIKRDL